MNVLRRLPVFRPLLRPAVFQPLRSLSQTPRLHNRDPAADYLVSLTLDESGAPDAEAQAWLEAIRAAKAELKPADGTFDPSKAFGAGTDFNLFEAAETQQQTKQFVPSKQQTEAYESVKDLELPVKNDSTLEFLAGVITRHGKKARARRYLSEALYLVYLRTRQNPVDQLKKLLDDMAPLVTLKRFSDGGARTEMVPVPLTERRRLRQAWDWILESSDRRQSKAFSVRLAEEILSAINGKSPGFDKRLLKHRDAITNRAYISLMMR